MNAQQDVVAICYLHESGIHTIRETRVMFDTRAELFDVGHFNIIHNLYRMRIAHRQHTDIHNRVRQFQRLMLRSATNFERHSLGVKDRRAHVDGNSAVLFKSG